MVRINAVRVRATARVRVRVSLDSHIIKDAHTQHSLRHYCQCTTPGSGTLILVQRMLPERMLRSEPYKLHQDLNISVVSLNESSICIVPQ